MGNNNPSNKLTVTMNLLLIPHQLHSVLAKKPTTEFAMKVGVATLAEPGSNMSSTAPDITPQLSLMPSTKSTDNVQMNVENSKTITVILLLLKIMLLLKIIM